MELAMRDNAKYYREHQQFRQWWLWFVILIGPITILAVFLPQMISSYAKDGSANIDLGLTLIMFVSAIGPGLFIFYLRLDTNVQQDGVYIKFKPFHRKWVIFPFEAIKQATPVTYRPIRDYGGWGIRYGNKGKAYNVSGNEGVLLEFTKAKPILIGSQKSQDLSTVINKYLS
jgi:uncharacterized protein with PQ loop repeat